MAIANAPLAAPTGLTASAVECADAHCVFRAAGDDDFMPYDAVADASYTDQSAVPGAQYRNKIVAFAHDTESRDSEPIEVTAP